MSPKFIKKYKKYKNIENLLEVIGVLLLEASIVLLEFWNFCRLHILVYRVDTF